MRRDSDERRADFSPQQPDFSPAAVDREAASDRDGTEVPSPRTEVRSPEELPPWETETSAQVLRRIKRTAGAAYLVFTPISLYLGGFRGFLGLTCSAAVTIIAFLWLEEIVEVVLQPAPSVRAWRLTLRSLARFALLGVALTVTIIVARFNAVSVLMGFSIIVVGICGEALYSLYRSLTQ
ncbi:MAG: hypothetical protein WA208_01690 [Thermoanaerobaculia bacterium]